MCFIFLLQVGVILLLEAQAVLKPFSSPIMSSFLYGQPSHSSPVLSLCSPFPHLTCLFPTPPVIVKVINLDLFLPSYDNDTLCCPHITAL